MRGIYTDWQVISSYSALKAFIPYQAYAILVWSLRYLAATLFWLAAIFVYVEVGLRNSRYTWMGLFTSSLLVFIPPALLTGQAGARPDLPSPWDTIILIASLLVALLGLAGSCFSIPSFRTVASHPAGCAGRR